jgi:DNA (cytosine-5)-methyltransferase 3A
MKKNYVVLSCFDGIGGGITALKRAGINFKKYYASEVEESAMTISMTNHNEIIQLGDIRNITKAMFKEKVDIIIGGSPCQGFSFAGRRKGMIDVEHKQITTLDQYLKLKAEGFEFIGQSYLFWEFIRLVRELKPKYFLLENVLMTKNWLYVISRELDVLPIHINSNLVSFQNRDRLYWTNIPNVSEPKDLGIRVGYVIPGAIGGFGSRGVDKGNKHPNGKIKWEQKTTTRKDHKVNCITTKKGSLAQIEFQDGSIRYMTVEEAEKAQTLPKGYTNVPGVSQTERWKGIGNGWTIDVISHLLKNLK